MKSVSIHTLGCRSNQYDSAAIEGTLIDGGLTLLPFPAIADAYVINTCTVTGRTDSQSRQAARRARRLNPEAVVIVTGCYAQVSPEEVAAIEGVDYVLGNPEKDRVVEFIMKGRRSNGGAGAVKKDSAPLTLVGPSESGAPLTLRAARAVSGRTRANLKIQDGCDRSCSYCIIPTARGRSKSLPMNRVLEEIELLVEKNFYEVVFTGIHLGGWGEDLHGAPHPTITELINEIERRRFRARFRLSSIDPDEITDPLIEALATAESFCNHVHMPLQSGDDSILRRMKRPYSVAFFAERVARLMHTVKEISIGTDIITGFPGESEVEFENTFSFLSELPISYMHIFPYSGRKGTAAAGMEGQVDPRAIKERAVRLKELEGAKREAFYSGLLGKTALVLAEGKEGAGGAKKGLLKGRSRNYVPVEFECPADGAQGEHRLLLTGLTGKGMFGEIENASQPASL